MRRLPLFQNFFLEFRRVWTTVIRLLFHETFGQGWSTSFYLADLDASINIRPKRLLPTNHYSRGAKLLHTVAFRATSESPDYIRRMNSFSLDLVVVMIAIVISSICCHNKFLIVDLSLNILLVCSLASKHHHCLRQLLGIDKFWITDQVRIAFIVIDLIGASKGVRNSLG